MNTKKFTILHSNDMHGDFLAESGQEKEKSIGGLALLSGYINKVRREEKNVLYVISGDMVQGSLIDSEYKGISTIEIMNYLSPDVVTLGNHEFDYGLAHLLFLEKMANFPIVNANLYIKHSHKRLMKPYCILRKDGFDFLFTGIITEKVIDAINMDPLVGSFISLEEAGCEVGKITNAYKNNDIDCTVLLTHIGFESDKALAALLDQEWGVDIIIGGHSHTILEKPEVINNIKIVQAGTSSNQIGRMDIVVDDKTNAIVEYQWKLVPITDETIEPDEGMEKFIRRFSDPVERKYASIITKFPHAYTHPKREIETELGDYIADIFAAAAEADCVFIGSGSIRSVSLGPVVTLKDLKTCFPYDDSITRFSVQGKTLRKILSYIMRKENRNSEGECYQVNSQLSAVFDDVTEKLISILVRGVPLVDELTYTIALQGYHVQNSSSYLNVSQEELLSCGSQKVVTTSAYDVLEAYLRSNQQQINIPFGRLRYIHG